MWAYLALYLVTAALSYLLTPRPTVPQTRTRTTPAPQQQEAPDAATSGPVPVVWGRVWLVPNVVWYGDTSAEAIQECQTVQVGGGGKK